MKHNVLLPQYFIILKNLFAIITNYITMQIKDWQIGLRLKCQSCSFLACNFYLGTRPRPLLKTCQSQSREVVRPDRTDK